MSELNVVTNVAACDLSPGVEIDDFGWWRPVVRVYRRPQPDGTLVVESSFGSVCRAFRGTDIVRIRIAPDVHRRWGEQREADTWYACEVAKMSEMAPA